MSAKRITTVGVIFGGRSVEHDVSVVTAHQIMRAFDREQYEVVPIYISRDGRWFSGDPLLDLKNFSDEIVSLSGVRAVILSPGIQHHGLILNPLAGRFSKSEIKRIDVAFPAVHGTHGEDGTLQGLLELADIPYVGCRTLASAVANDKIMTKTVLRQHNIPVVDDFHFSRSEWLENPDSLIEQIVRAVGLPLFVKPSTTGSSIGIGRADNEAMLRASIDIAAHFDRRILVEAAISGHVEINCSVMGHGSQIQASVLEQPISWDEFLTYEEKYLRGSEGMKSAERIIPAPISADLTARIQQLAIDTFRIIDGCGIARIDFLVQPDKGVVYLNEINTMPGSLAFYLWQETGIGMSELVHRLVELARDAYAEKRRTSYDYRTDLINLAQMRGLKGVKGAKSGASAARSTS
ncbi:MAG TPA: D-alanine--D-alanine ligase family protein [Spirillospora sp.]|nr:D-alanine--D-alanine ligase family protein [Spirillospora sp.]